MSEEKKSDECFVKFITEYDIICLSETWTSKKSSIELSGYSDPIHFYRKTVHRIAKRNSGGLIVYIKDGIQLIKNVFDCMIWPRLDKTFFKMSEDIYYCAIYIPPENSRFHQLYDIDIFKILEMDITEYSNKGQIVVAGDF